MVRLYLRLLATQCVTNWYGMCRQTNHFVFWKLEMSPAIVLVGGIGSLVSWAIVSRSYLASDD